MKKFFAVLTMVFLLSGGVFAGEIDLAAKTSGVKIVTQKMTDPNNIKMVMNCSIDKLHSYDAETPQGNFTVLYTPEFYFGGEYGTPQLPVFTKLVQIPFGAEIRVEVKGYDSKVYNLADFGISNPIFPRQPSAPKDGSEVPFVYEKSSYIFKGFHGLQLASFKEVGTLRHMRLAHLTIAPIKYNPVENTIVVYNNIEFEVILENSDMKTTKNLHSKLWSPAFAGFEKMVTIPEALRFGSRNDAQGYMIVADPMFKDVIAPFAAWKTEAGYKVDMVYTDQFGENLQAGLKDYIHNAYNNPTAEKPAPSYVLFVGDHEQIPAFSGKTGSHITDLYYVAVTPGDVLPDILTGRFSAQTVAELEPQVEKTLEYEQYLFPDDSFLKDVVLTAGWDYSWAKSHGWSHINYATTNYFNEENGFNTVNVHLSAGSQDSSAQIVSEVAKGAAYVNYTAHGSTTTWADPRFTITDIKNLGNKSEYPLVIGNCCITNKFQYSQCFGEAWLRAEDAGAIGYVGGSNSTYWDEDLWWGVGVHSIVKPNNQGVPPAKSETGPGAFEAMFEGPGVTNAGFMVAGNLAVEESSSGRKQYYWEVYHLMGDPSLKTYMGQNEAVRGGYPQVINSEAKTIKVFAAAGSYVGISFEGKLLGAGYVTEKGYVVVQLNSLPESGEAKIVITGGNISAPHIGKIAIK